MTTTLRMPKAWEAHKNSLTARKDSPKKTTAAVDMSADTVNNLLCPVTKQPMKIVRIHYRNADGTMDPSYVAVHPESRVCLPLTNEMLAELEKNPPKSTPTLPTYQPASEPARMSYPEPNFQQWDQY